MENLFPSPRNRMERSSLQAGQSTNRANGFNSKGKQSAFMHFQAFAQKRFNPVHIVERTGNTFQH
jgi:hypothetical protein